MGNKGTVETHQNSFNHHILYFFPSGRTRNFLSSYIYVYVTQPTKYTVTFITYYFKNELELIK